MTEGEMTIVNISLNKITVDEMTLGQNVILPKRQNEMFFKIVF